MTDNYAKVQKLEGLARQIRIECVKSVYQAGSGHLGGSLSAVDILTVLYFDKMNIRVEQPHWSDRDRFILSKGHAAPGLYAALAIRGFFPIDELKTLRKVKSKLSGHPTCFKTPGVDMTSGSLGHGLSNALGMCMAARVRGKDFRSYVLLGDGEIQEGQVWEAAMAAAHFKINRLIAIVDYNRVQLDGTVGEIMEVEPLIDKWKSFGWTVLSTDGHDMFQLLNILDDASVRSESGPVVIIARTIKGKGISYMENKAEWHGKVPDEKEFNQAMEELKQ